MNSKYERDVRGKVKVSDGVVGSSYRWGARYGGKDHSLCWCCWFVLCRLDEVVV